MIMITIKISELLTMVKDLKKSGCKYVEITEFEADDDFPKSLHFEALNPEDGCAIDYEEIEESIPD